MNRLGMGLLSVLFGAVLAGCESTRADRPPHIRYGEETCASCHMLISEERFAAAARTASGETRLFDEIGCLLQQRQQLDAEGARIWVHDYESGAWLEAAQAVFVRSRELPTPMGHGIVAVATRAAAARVAQEVHGEIMEWSQLTQEA